MNYSLAITIAKILACLCLIWAGWKGANRCENHFKNKNDDTSSTKLDTLLAPMMGKLIKSFVLIFGVFVIAGLLHLPLASLLTGLGIGGIAIAMAAKETIANVFGSVTVLLDRPFQIGDWVKIGDIEGHVESMGFRSTRIRTFYDSLITIPNATLLTANVDNMGARKYRRVKTSLRISYNTTSDKINALRAQISHVFAESNLVRKEGCDLVLEDYGPTCLSLGIQFFLQVHSAEAEREEKHRILNTIIQKAHDLLIELPPTPGV